MRQRYYAVYYFATQQHKLGAESTRGVWMSTTENGTATRLTVTVVEAGRLLGLSRNSVYEAVRRGDIPSISIGRRRLIPRGSLERMLESATTTNNA